MTDAAKKTADQTPVSPAGIDKDKNEVDPNRRFLLFKAMPSWLASFLVNLTFILVLALFAITTEKESVISLEAGELDNASVAEIDLNVEEMDLSETEDLENELTEVAVQEIEPELEQLTFDTDLLSDDSNILAAETSNFEGAEFSELTDADLTSEVSGRSGNSKPRH